MRWVVNGWLGGRGSQEKTRSLKTESIPQPALSLWNGKVVGSKVWNGARSWSESEAVVAGASIEGSGKVEDREGFLVVLVAMLLLPLLLLLAQD